MQIRRGAEHLRIVGIERHGAGVRRAGLLDVAQLGERGAAEVVRRDAGPVGAGGFARALQRIVVASALEVARRLVQQVRQRRVAAACHGQAGSGRWMGLLARVGRGIERFGNGRRRPPHRGCLLDAHCRGSRLLAASVHCQGDRRGGDQCMAEGLLSHRWLVKHSGSASAFPTGGPGGTHTVPQGG